MVINVKNKFGSVNVNCLFSLKKPGDFFVEIPETS